MESFGRDLWTAEGREKRFEWIESGGQGELRERRAHSEFISASSISIPKTRLLFVLNSGGRLAIRTSRPAPPGLSFPFVCLHASFFLSSSSSLLLLMIAGLLVCLVLILFDSFSLVRVLTCLLACLLGLLGLRNLTFRIWLLGIYCYGYVHVLCLYVWYFFLFFLNGFCNLACDSDFWDVMLSCLYYESSGSGKVYIYMYVVGTDGWMERSIVVMSCVYSTQFIH